MSTTSNHLTVGIYPNGDWVYNVVRDKDLADHIAYNTTFRFGRLLYVDGKRVYGGCIKEEYLAEFDKRYETIAKTLSDVNMNTPTIPYR